MVKELFSEYWKLIVESLITAPLVLYFWEASLVFKIIMIIIILFDFYLIYYTLFELNDPKLLIGFIITEYLS